MGVWNFLVYTNTSPSSETKEIDHSRGLHRKVNPDLQNACEGETQAA